MSGIWESVDIIQSTDENVAKYVFKKDDAVAEAVLYKYPTYDQRTVICCSTQSGCPVGCRFCGAGDYFVRSLTSSEIVAQPVRLLDDTNVDPARIERLQIMFMSMGEPLLNMKALIPALADLYDRYPNAALLISTSAPKINYDEVIGISRVIPTIGLQFSIHESTDEARDKLIPFKQKLSLASIALVGQQWYLATGRRPFFNYCAHEGNSSDLDADRLLGLFDPAVWECTISVICERDESVAAANARQRELALGFAGKMLARDFSTRTFDPAGQDDIGGGCGQLWFVQDWMREHPEQARPSIGHSLPMIHTPALTPA
jgi:23S rRNA (adenine2503-C2)-methyltransferase